MMDTELLLYVALWLLRTIIATALFLYVWSSRGELGQWLLFPLTCCTSLNLLRREREPDALAIHVEEEFQQLRLSRVAPFVKRMMPVMAGYMLYMLLQSLLVDTSNALWSSVGIIVTPGPIFVIGLFVAKESWRTSRWHLDLIMAYAYTNISTRVVLHSLGVLSQQNVSSPRVRAGLQGFMTLTFLDYKKSAVANLSVGVVEALAYAYCQTCGTEQTQDPVGRFAGYEVTLFAFLMITAYVMEDAARLLVRRSIETRSSEANGRAVESILDVLCDAVVHLGSDLRLLKDCPTLGHLLLSGLGMTGTAVARCDFIQHLVEKDRLRFKEFLARHAKTRSNSAGDQDDSAAVFPIAPTAINVSLRDSVGSVFKVQRIHARLQGLDSDGHLLGIRDLGDSARMSPIRSSEPQSQPRMHETGSRTASSVTSDSSSRASSAAASAMPRSLGLCHLGARAVTLLVDVFDEKYPVREVVLTVHDASNPTARSAALPMSSLFSGNSYSKLTAWLTTTVNDLAYGRAPRPIHDVTFSSEGDSAIMRAGRVHARFEGSVGRGLLTNERCLVNLRFEELALQTQPRNPHAGKAILPRIQKTACVSSGARPLHHEAGTAQPQGIQSQRLDGIKDDVETSQMRVCL
eukprot:TRINITY_DN23457_c0_g1_i1.p1 TRINITY_DN23457_c0_g1~~TRINITY_DN23457_c0_g1_i1.p1  ORF type:complete len:632 (+),score=48.67 TRINITY_DN23457_c0_g1_i1:145-2040(+)